MRIEHPGLAACSAAALNPATPCRILTRLSEKTGVVPLYVSLLVSARWVAFFAGTIFAATASTWGR